MDGSHERDGENGHPEVTISKNGTGLGIGADARWVVVRSSGDKARAKVFEKVMEFMEEARHDSMVI